MNENMNAIGEVADTLDNLTVAMTAMSKLPAETHLAALKEALPEASKKLKDAVIAETGENPWT